MTISESFTMEDAKKVHEYLESGKEPKIKIAQAKIDQFIKIYLKHLKYELKINRLDVGLTNLEALSTNDNLAIKEVINRYREYMDKRKVINGLQESDEKNRLIQELKMRDLWEI
jgi:hypothetical protein